MRLVMPWKTMRSWLVWLRMKILGGRRKRIEIMPVAKEDAQSMENPDEKDLPEMVKQTRQAVAKSEQHARKLLHFHHASPFRKLLLKTRYSFARTQTTALREGAKIITSVSTNAKNIQQTLQKYEQTKLSNEGRKWKHQLHDLRVRMILSRWLLDLIAIHITSANSQRSTVSPLPQSFTCCFESEAETHSFSFTLTDSLKIELDLTCPICLDTLFDPVSLGCGHVFCFSCACDAASVLRIEGLKSANKNLKCPSCRKEGVFVRVLRLKGLNILIKRRCKEQWHERRERERAQRLAQAKEYWNGQIALFMVT